MFVVLILHTVPSPGFEAQTGARMWISCPCTCVKSFIFNQMEACQEFSHLLSNADKTLQLIPRWGGLKSVVLPDVMRVDNLWCHTWKDSHSMVYPKKYMWALPGLPSHITGRWIFDASRWRRKLPLSLIINSFWLGLCGCLFYSVAQRNLRGEIRTGLGVTKMNVGIDVGTQRGVLYSPMNAAYLPGRHLNRDKQANQSAL